MAKHGARAAVRGGLMVGVALAALLANVQAHAQSALPTGGTVTSGAATIATAGTTTTVTQTGDRAIVNWQSFDVAAGHGVVFAQPGAASATLNRVTGAASRRSRAASRRTARSIWSTRTGSRSRRAAPYRRGVDSSPRRSTQQRGPWL